MFIPRIAIVAGLLLAISYVVPALSAPRAPLPAAPAQDYFTLEGKITDKSPGKVTVSGGENIIFHVVYNEKTAIRKPDGSPATADDLHIGLTIAVAGDLADSGEIAAKTIDIKGQGSGKQ
jgi:hypothetical protein